MTNDMGGGGIKAECRWRLINEWVVWLSGSKRLVGWITQTYDHIQAAGWDLGLNLLFQDPISYGTSLERHYVCPAWIDLYPIFQSVIKSLIGNLFKAFLWIQLGASRNFSFFPSLLSQYYHRVAHNQILRQLIF